MCSGFAQGGDLGWCVEAMAEESAGLYFDASEPESLAVYFFAAIGFSSAALGVYKLCTPKSEETLTLV